jgi:predicted GNAT family N-acyltransferase
MVEVIQQQLGWDPFKNTHKIVADISPEGVLFGKLGGKIMSSILATKYSKGFGFIGVYYVRKADRGKGYGYKIFVKAMEFLSDCEVLALDSVEEQIPNYVKWGFQVACNSTKRFVK